jgi:hypothetical protein
MYDSFDCHRMQPLDVIQTDVYCIFLGILETRLPGDKVRLSRKDLDEATTLDHHLAFFNDYYDLLANSLQTRLHASGWK